MVHGYEPPDNDELVGTIMGWTIMFRRRREASRAFQWFTARVAPLGGNAQSAAPSQSPASSPSRSTANNVDLVFGEAHAHVPTRLTRANFGDGSCLHGFCWFRIMQRADYDLMRQSQFRQALAIGMSNRVYRPILGDGQCGFRSVGAQIFNSRTGIYGVTPRDLQTLRFAIHYTLTTHIDAVMGAVAGEATVDTRKQERAAVLEHARQMVEVDLPDGRIAEVNCDGGCGLGQYFGGG